MKLPITTTNRQPPPLPFLLVALVVVLGLSEVRGHVALTFPPARSYDLDFLDTFRTQGPCGMPKGGWCCTGVVVVVLWWLDIV